MKLENNVLVIKNKYDEWGPTIPLENDELITFDTDVFSEEVRDFIKAVAEETQTPIDASAMAHLMILSTVLGSKYIVISNGSEWKESLNIFVIVALESGNRKSTVFKIFELSLLNFTKEMQKKLEPSIKQLQLECEMKKIG